MKKVKHLFMVLAVMVFTLSGCGEAKYVFSGTGTKFKIEVNAGNDDYGESFDFSVGKNRQIVISPELSEGSLTIDFAEVDIFMTDPDTPEDRIVGDVIGSVTITGNEQVTITLPEYEYVMQCTAHGSTKGTVTVEVVKN